MPIPTSISDLSTTAASNSPAGSESPTEGDNYIRALSAIIAQETLLTTKAATLADATSASNGAGLVGRSAQVVDSITSLRGLNKNAASKHAVTTGYYAAGDGGGCLYYCDAADTTSADDGVGVIVATDGGRWKPVLSGVFNARAAGLRMDGATNDATRFVAAVTYCQVALQNLRFGKGIPTLATQVTLSGNPITFIGEEVPSKQQGSQLPSCTLRWTGGATAMFSMISVGWSFIGMAVENRGTATDFIESSTTQYLTLDTVSFLVGSGATRFSRSILRTPANAFGYGKYRNIAFQGAAPAFLDADGNGASNGITSLEFDGGLYESNALGNVTIIKLKDINVTALSIHNATWNQQASELCIVDTTDTPRSITLTQFSFKDNEVDTVANIAGDRSFKLTNALNVAIDDNYFQGGGTRNSFATLVNTQVSSFQGNRGERIASTFFSADTLSNLNIGKNDFNTSNTGGYLNDSATGSGMVPLTYGVTVTMQGHKLAPGQGFRVDVTNGVGWTLTFQHPGISAGSFFYPGQKFDLLIRNTSGGAMGAITINTTYFKVAGAALPVPANGFSRTVRFYWNGAALVELGRTTTDVPN